MAEFIVDPGGFTSFVPQKSIYSLDMTYGANTATSTPTIVDTAPGTYRFAIRTPQKGFLQSVRIQYLSHQSGPADAYVDFSLFRTSFSNADFDPFYDRIYEKKQITHENYWEHSFTNNPIPFSNRLGYVGTDPSTNKPVTSPRNFMWIELRPASLSGSPAIVAPIYRVQLFVEI